MTRLLLSSLLVLCSASAPAAEASPSAGSAATHTFNVRDFGAKGDGKTKETAAFQKALDACAKAGGGTVLIPAGYYLSGSIVLRANTKLVMEFRAVLLASPDLDDYPLVRVRWEGEFSEGHRGFITAEKADNVSIVGPGTIIGPSMNLSQLRNPRGPSLIEIVESNNVVLDGFTTQYQQLWSVHLLYCESFTARNLTIRTVFSNGDGIDVDSCKEVLIEHCNIDTGDDAISLKSGRGMEAVRIARPTENVVIRDCMLSSSLFAAIGLGTEISGGVRHVRIENCVISGRQNAIYIKSREGRGGIMDDIVGENLIVNRSPTFIGIDLVNKGIQATEPVVGDTEKWTLLRNVHFNNIQVNNVTELIAGKHIPAQRPADGLTLTNIHGTCERAISLANVINAKLGGITVTGFEGPLLHTSNVKGSGLENPAAPLSTETAAVK